MRKLLGPIMALFLLAVNATEAVAPSKPEEIPASSFHTVILDHPILDFPIMVTPVPSYTPRPNVAPTAPIKILTTEPPVVHTKPTVSDAKAYALAVLGSTQYACIDKIFIKESNWNPFDLNKSSGAYGIPQALPGSKMAVIASDWRTNPVTQVKWGIRYVNGRYGSACAAWSFWLSHRWY